MVGRMKSWSRWGALTVPAAAAAAGAVGWWGTQQLVNPDRASALSLAASCDEAVPGDVPAALAARFAAFPHHAVRVRLWGPSAGWPGIWGALWQDGFGVVGEPRAADRTSAVRDLLVLGGTPPEPAPLAPVPITLRGSVWPDNPVRMGVRCQDVDVPGRLGPLPCWQIPASEERHAGDGSDGGWVVYVHGRGSGRAQASRTVPVAASSGWTSLVLSYRNDPGAPRTGRYRLGDDEWEDLESAAAYALGHGARRLVLLGYSMGGAIVQSFLRRSALAEAVGGVILDAPVTDWRAVVRGVARRTPLGLLTAPTTVPLVMAAAGWRAGIDWRRLDFLKAVAELSVPILLFHGTDDPIVPVTSSDRLAAARPDLVEYHRVEGAGHVESWNHAPDRYDEAVRTFLAACGQTGPLPLRGADAAQLGGPVDVGRGETGADGEPQPSGALGD